MRRHRVVVVAVVIAASIVRLVYGLLILDPLSGPDAGTYLAAARALEERGLTATDVPGIPYWPAGYPMLLSLLFKLPGAGLTTMVAAQVALLGVATYLLFSLVAREWRPDAGVVAAVLLSLSPALVAAPGLLMYEPLLLSGLTVGAELMSRATHAQGPRAVALASGGAGVIGFAAMLQQRALLAGVLVIGWLLYRRPAAMVSLLAIAALAVGPLLLGARTLAAEGRFALAGNTGVTMAMGFNPEATGGYLPSSPQPPGCEQRDDWVLRDLALVRCSLAWAAEHPASSARLAISKAARFWDPLTGSRQRGTWFHAFDYRRLLPAAVRTNRAMQAGDHLLSVAWSAATLGLVLGGLAVSFRDPRLRAGAVLFGLLVGSFLLTTLGSIGDARFRLPVAPFYVAFQALAVVTIHERRRSPSDG